MVILADKNAPKGIMNEMIGFYESVIAFPVIDPVIFSLGFLEVRWYSLAYLGGILLGWWLVKRVTAKAHDPIGHPPVDALINAGIVGIIIGGRLVYILFYNLPYYLADPIRVLYVWEGGLSFHGGFLGMVVATILVARRYRVAILGLGDLVSMVAPIGLFFGRLANFINDELYGRATDVPWAVAFPSGGFIPRHPSQIYEALLEGVLLFIILTTACRYGARLRLGLMTGIFMVGYSMARFFVEFFREPDTQLGLFFGAFSLGQFLSLPMLFIGLILMAYALRRPAA